jgi:alanine racemase
VPAILHHDLISAVYTREFALALGESADALGRVAPYHLKIDSGMNRIGVHYSDAGDFLRSLSFHRALDLQGCFTHFATADSLDSFGLQTQQERFEQAIETIRYMGIKPGIIHAANSAAAIRFKHLRYDMVRLGISLYGLHPSELTRNLVRLRPAMSVHARVNSIKAVPLGEGVGYGFNYRSPGGVLIATIPIGYGDGLSRALSERINILVDGHAYPQVGTICMDMCMFEINQRPDISSLRRAQISANRPSVEFGSEAIIVGKNGDLEISMDDLARKMGTISYDLACMFGLRLERVYRD